MSIHRNPGSDVVRIEDDNLVLQELSDFDDRAPSIESPDGDVVFRPPIVTRVNGILPFNNAIDTSLCGQTEVADNGDSNWRATVEGVCFYRHLSTISRLRQTTDGEVRLIMPMTTELASDRVMFDRIELDRPEELNDRPVHFGTEIVEEPIYEFQFQSKAEE
jgi:hypothetical protein